MLSLDVSLAMPEQLGAVIFWSGSIRNKLGWLKELPAKKEIKVGSFGCFSDPLPGLYVTWHPRFHAAIRPRYRPADPSPE